MRATEIWCHGRSCTNMYIKPLIHTSIAETHIKIQHTLPGYNKINNYITRLKMIIARVFVEQHKKKEVSQKIFNTPTVYRLFT